MTDWLDVSDTTPRKAYIAAPGQNVFAVPFVFYTEADLAVYVDGVRKTLSTHYATSGALDPDGGNVTFTTAMVGGEAVVVELDLAYELTTHIATTGDLDVAAINLQFSRFMSLLQQAHADWPRALRQPAGDTTDFDDLPAAASRALKYLFFDADGQPALVAGVTLSAAATAYWSAILAGTSSGPAARAALGISDQSAYTGLSNWHTCR